MKTIITLDRANKPYGYPQLDSQGRLSATGSLFGTASFAVSASWAPTLSTTFISTGSVSASVNTTGNIFTVASSSANLLTVSSSGIVTVATSGSSTTMRLHIGGAIYPTIETLANAPIIFRTNNADRFKISSTAVVTNVPLELGTGPGTPLATIRSSGSAVTDMLLIAGTSGSVRGSVYVQSGNLIAQGGGFSVTTGSTSYINVFPSNGNVFVGSTPIDGGFKLDVNGTIRSQNSNYTVPSIRYGGLMQAGTETYIGSSTTASRAIWGNASGNALTLAGNSRFGGTAGAMVVIGALYDFSTTSQYPNSAPLLRVGYDSGDWFGDTSQVLSNTTFETIQIRQKYNVTGSTNRVIGIDYDPVFINSPQTHYAAIFRSGFVGIGTATPSSSLDVSGSGRFTDGLTVTGSATITNVLTLPYQDPLPSSPATGSIALSGSGATFVGMFVWTGVWTQI